MPYEIFIESRYSSNNNAKKKKKNNRKRQYIESYFSCHCFAKSQQKACII